MSSPTETYASGRDSSKAKRGHFGDALLRRHGFRIQARPAVGPALWVWPKTGHVYTEAEAHRRVATLIEEAKK